MIKYNKHVSLPFSENSRVLSEREQWTYCKSLSVANHSTWAKLNVILSRKPDHKLLSFLACCQAKRTGLDIPFALQYFFKQFTPDEKQNIAIIRSHINTFYSVIMKYIEIQSVIHVLIPSLPEIKPK